MDLASFEVVRGCAGALLALLREGLLDIAFCNVQEAAALAEVVPHRAGPPQFGVLRRSLGVNESRAAAYRMPRARLALGAYCIVGNPSELRRGRTGCRRAA